MYFKLRLTPGVIFDLSDTENPTTESRRFCKRIIKEIISKNDLACYSCGYELLNKYGETTKAHYHFVFEDDSGKTKDAIRKQIIRFSEKLGHKLRGNAMYSLGQDEEPDDINRWLRYSHKQSQEGDKPFTWGNKFPSDFNYAEQQKLAIEEFKRTSSQLVKNRDKIAEKETFYDKIVKYLEEKGLKDLKSIHIAIQQFYIQEKKPINYSTVDGYTITYMLSNQLMSPEEGFELYSRLK